MNVKRWLIAVAAFVVASAVVFALLISPIGDRTGSTAGTVGSEPGRTASAAPEISAGEPTAGAGSPAPKPAASAAPSDSADPGQRLPAPVLQPAGPKVVSDPAAVRARIENVSRKGVGGVYSGSVVAVGSGEVLFAHRANAVETPASVNKLLTTGAALAQLGPSHRFTTRVVRASKTKVILVGGGDPYLSSKSTGRYPARGSVASLARQTAKSLKAAKVTTVSVGYDASLFSGPAWNPTWPAVYGDQVTPTSALWVNEGRVYGYSPGPRYSDPARQAGLAYAAALRRQGIKVRSVAKAKAGSRAPVLATVQSMPMDQIVEQILMASDNDGAEVLFRQLAVTKGKPGSIAQGGRQAQITLTKLGVWGPGTVMRDGSGLSRGDRVSARSLTKLLRLAALDSQPQLRGLLTGLPVAGVEGSLKHRFTGGEYNARGIVRGKTGTLRRVYSLAGYLRTKDGTVVAYAFIANEAKNEFNTKAWLDEVTAAVASCGCRG